MRARAHIGGETIKPAGELLAEDSDIRQDIRKLSAHSAFDYREVDGEVSRSPVSGRLGHGMTVSIPRIEYPSTDQTGYSKTPPSRDSADSLIRHNLRSVVFLREEPL